MSSKDYLETVLSKLVHTLTTALPPNPFMVRSKVFEADILESCSRLCAGHGAVFARFVHTGWSVGIWNLVLSISGTAPMWLSSDELAWNSEIGAKVNVVAVEWC